MSLDMFQKKLEGQCKILFESLRDGSRLEKLKDKKLNSLTDVMFIGRENPRKIYQSCIITFGHVLEKATMDYAEEMNAKVYRKKKFLASEHDIIFRIKRMVYNLESKSNIELDLGKTKKALETLNRKHKIVFNALDCQTEAWQVISKFIVWTKENSKTASMIAKRPLEEKHLMGFKDFFHIFDVEVGKDDFFKMLQDVWIKEVEAHI